MAKQEKTAAEIYREKRKARIAKAAKRNAKKSHRIILTKGAKRAIAAVIILALVGGLVGAVVNNSGVLEKNKTALYVGDIKVTAPEYCFYYSSLFSNLFEEARMYAMYYGMNYGYNYLLSPDVQPYPGEIEGVENPMFTDYFEYTAKQNLRYVKASVLYAKENGIELDETDYANIEQTMQSLESTATTNNLSPKAYLKAAYGKGMTIELFRKICEEQTINNKVQTVKTEEFSDVYTDKKVEKIYNKDLKTYGVVSLRLYEVVAESVEVPGENEGDPSTKKVTEESMAAAKTKAESFIATVKDVDSFKATAAEFEKAAKNDKWEDMKNDDSKTAVADINYSNLSYDVSDKDFLKWAFDKETAVGSTYIVENKDVGYSVYMMENPVHKIPDEVSTYDVRHILIQFPEKEQDDAAKEETKKEDVKVELLDPSKYDVTVDIDVDLENTGDKALYKEAQTILEGYLAGEKTEEAFGELAKKHSADGNAAEGGIYTDVTLGKMVAEFEGWAIEPGRKKGDVGIVETEHGYHIMYYIGADIITWADVIRDEKSAEDYNEFATELENGDNVKISSFSDNSAEKFVIKLAKRMISASKQSSSQMMY